ncbi:NUDIX domain-containing protein [Henriciella barbarensis]|uniref:NUDIX domain-containing protein n=1 Tax=Henriciella barbarensis TaxID=86342 RepID=A0A399QYL4_9PROT|nr:NUDIX hydrolase [Henriciella barbarensis]RIJ23621.1 NUDIX domain-containing protein [Henriciella barbarensis]
MPFVENSPKLADGVRPQPAAGVVCLREDQVLLIRRGTPPMTGEWSLPGGRIEPGETAKDAALRELKEETGVDAYIAGLLDVVDAIIKNREGSLITRHYVLCDYLAIWTSGEPLAGDDAAEAGFFDLSDVPDLKLWDETRRIIDAGVALAASLPENSK